ncbi:MAG: VWA domain-containing protein [Bryobacteraceae bacterium]|nr:VWA domain-containing protein [Bryobacteraceae bacterium]
MRTRRWMVKAIAGSGVSAAAEQEWRLVSDVRLVILDVAVTDERGHPVTGLERDAFRVFDDGRPRPISAFAAEDSPVTVALVVDSSGSMRKNRRDLLTAAASLLEAGNPEDETSLVTFNDSVRIAPSGAAILQTLAVTALQGRTALYDAIRTGLDRVQAGARERKALVVLSDGGDNASVTSRDEIIRRAQLSQAAIHTVGIQDADQSERDPGFLRRISYLTGGESVQDVKPEQLPDVCRQLARSIRSRYMLAFRAADTAAAQKREIRLEVTLPSGKAKVRTRPSYLATPVSQTEVAK